MTITCDFAYFRPKNIEEALQLLAKYKGKAKILAGGTDLIGWLKKDEISPQCLIDIKAIKGLNQIVSKKGMLEIGSLVTFSDILDSKVIKQHLPFLQEMAIQAASVGIRNRATIVGNICAAVPCCDNGPALLTCDASVVVRSAKSKGEKIIPITKWFLAPKKTIIKSDEMVIKILIPLPKEKSVGCHIKLRRYNGEDLAQASVAIFASKKTCRIAFGAVAPTPVRAYAIEAALAEDISDFTSDVSGSTAEKLTKLLPKIIKPITDIRASKEYRMHMVKIMLERGLHAIATRLKNNSPEYGANLI